MNTKSQKPPVKMLKGLDSLFGEEPLGTQSLPLSSITLPSHQPRRYFDPHKMEQLVQSVKEHGIIEPLLVRLIDKPNTYELVAGERRYRAAQIVGLSEVPVVVRSLSTEEAFQLALIENLQREDLNPVEETEGILQLLAFKLKQSIDEIPKILYRMQNEQISGKSNGNVTINSEVSIIEEVFSGLGLMSWESFIRNRLPLLNLPNDILEVLYQGKIAYTKAVALSKVKDETQRQNLLAEAITQNLSLAQIRQQIEKALTSSKKEPISLKSRVKETHQRLQKTKIWDNPKKRKRLEKLLSEMEALLTEE
jgi:ParB family chromosome partitioning protein